MYLLTEFPMARSALCKPPACADPSALAYRGSRGSFRSVSTRPRGRSRFNVLGDTLCLFGTATTFPASLCVSGLGDIAPPKNGKDRWAKASPALLQALRGHLEAIDLDGSVEEWSPEQRQ